MASMSRRGWRARRARRRRVSGEGPRPGRQPARFAFEDLGEQRLKNIDRPVRVYSVSLGEPAGRAPRRRARADKPSIAVLPFDNMSGDPEQQYFSDGITEDIITDFQVSRAVCNCP